LLLNIEYNIFYLVFLGSKALAVKGLYWANFIMSTYFFVFLMKKKELVIYKRVLFFCLYYFLFCYTLIRNGPSYILVALFYFYYLDSDLLKRKVKYLWISLLFHYSSLGVLAINYLSNLTKKQVVILFSTIIILGIAAFIGFDISIDIIQEKYERYSSSWREEKLTHKIWYYFVCILFILSFLENKYLAYTKINIAIFASFLILYNISHIAGYRFSIYCIMYYLVLQPSNRFFIVNKKYFNLGSLIFVGYFIFTFYDTHYR